MSNLIKLFDSFNTDINFKIDLQESDGGTGDLGEIPTGVLGVFKVNYTMGAGIPYGISRNGRLYTKKVWDKAFSDKLFKEVYENGLLVGMISHPNEDIDYDTMLKEGLASHKLIDYKFIEKEGKDKGIYETKYFILDTPAGRVLRTLLASGSKIAVSTRAYGSFKENAFVEYNGKKLPVIDENNFKLITIDIVTTPGIQNARISDFKLSEKEEIQFKEDLAYIEAMAKKYDCKDGLCFLIENNIKETTQNQDKQDIKSNLENLDKTDLVEMIKALTEENQKLNTLLTNTNINTSNKKPTKKTPEIIKFIANVEILMSLLKFNKKYEDDYRTLIEILDKDNIFEKEDITKVKKILNKITNDKEADESLKIFANKFLLFLDNVKFEESISYYIFKYYKDEINKLKNINLELVDKIENVINIEKENEDLRETLNKTKKILKETINIYNQEVRELKENLTKLKENYNLLKEKYNKLEENNKVYEDSNIRLINLYNEVIEEKNELENEVSNLKSQVTILENQNKEIIEKFDKENKKFNKQIKNILKEKENFEIKYYSLKYKITEDIVKENLHNPNKEKLFESMKYKNTNINNFDIEMKKEEKNEIEDFIDKIL